MPIYVYRCSRCEHEYEELVRNAAEKSRCPECESDAVERQPATFAVGAARGERRDETPFCGRCGLDRPPCQP